MSPSAVPVANAAVRKDALRAAGILMYPGACIVVLGALLAYRMGEYCEDAGGPCTNASATWHMVQGLLAAGVVAALVLTGLALGRLAHGREQPVRWSRTLAVAAMLMTLWLAVVIGLFPTPTSRTAPLPGAEPSSYEPPSNDPDEPQPAPEPEEGQVPAAPEDPESKSTPVEPEDEPGSRPEASDDKAAPDDIERAAEQFLDGFLPYLQGDGKAANVEHASPILITALERGQRGPRPVRFPDDPKLLELEITEQSDASAEVRARVAPATPALMIELSLVRSDDAWLVDRVELR